MTPGIVLLHPAGGGITTGQASEDCLSGLPAGDIECLEGLVREVEDMTDLDIPVVCGAREKHVRHLAVVPARPHGGDDAALRPFRVSHLDELAEPALHGLRVGGRCGK